MQKKIPYSICVFLILLIAIYSCEKKEDKYIQNIPSTSIPCKFGSGPLVRTDGFSINVDTTFSELKYEYYCYPSSSFYDTRDTTISIDRYDSIGNYTYQRRIEFTGSNIILDQIIYPTTFWPTYMNNSHLFLKIILNDNNIYSVSSTDTLRFSITLNNFVNDTLSGTFEGTLYNISNTSDSIIITNGQFGIKLSVYH